VKDAFNLINYEKRTFIVVIPKKMSNYAEIDEPSFFLAKSECVK